MSLQLILEPLYGLANRLRAIASGIALLERYDELTLDIVWVPDRTLGALYEELFEAIHVPRLRFGDMREYPLLETYYRPGRMGWRRTVSRLMCRATLVAPADAILPVVMAGNAQFCIRAVNSVVLSTCHEFFRPGQWKYFIPKAGLRDQIEVIAGLFGDHCIGVHIRRGDCIDSWQQSPLSAFIEVMRHEVDERSSTRFFLATDSEDVRTALLQIFGTERIITRLDLNLSRNSRSGIEDAVVDMWSLARTNRILGSHRSSFSRAAAQIGGIQLIRCYRSAAAECLPLADVPIRV